MLRPRTIIYWAIALVLAHIAGSYGMLLGQMVDDNRVRAPIGAYFKTPLLALPWLLQDGSRRLQTSELLYQWSRYLFPFAAVLIFAKYLVYLRTRRAQRARGFDVLPKATGGSPPADSFPAPGIPGEG